MRCWNTVHVILWHLPVEHAGDVSTQAGMLLAVSSPKWEATQDFVIRKLCMSDDITL